MVVLLVGRHGCVEGEGVSDLVVQVGDELYSQDNDDFPVLHNVDDEVGELHDGVLFELLVLHDVVLLRGDHGLHKVCSV